MAGESNRTNVTSSSRRLLALLVLVGALSLAGVRSGPLARVLEDFPEERPDVQRVSTFALQMYSVHGERAPHWLAQSVAQGWVSTTLAVYFLCDLDPVVAAANGDLLRQRARDTTDPVERLALLTLLAATSATDHEAHAEIRRAITGSDDQLRYLAPLLLQFRGSAKPFVGELASVLERDLMTQAAALGALGSVDDLPPDVELRIRSLLDEGNIGSAQNAVIALVGGGWVGESVITKAFDLADHENVPDGVLTNALLSMPRVKAASVREIPRRLLAHDDSAIRRVGESLLAWMGEERPDLAPTPPVPYGEGTLRDAIAFSGSSYIAAWRAVRAHRIALGEAGARRLARAVAAGWPPTRAIGLEILTIDPLAREAAIPYLESELESCPDPSLRIAVAILLLADGRPHARAEKLVLDALTEDDSDLATELFRIAAFPKAARLLRPRVDELSRQGLSFVMESIAATIQSTADRR